MGATALCYALTLHTHACVVMYTGRPRQQTPMQDQQ